MDTPASLPLPPRVTTFDIAAWLFVASALLLVLELHLLPALLGGLLVYELVRGLAPFIRSRPSEAELAKVIVIAVIAALVVTGMTLLILGALSFFRGDSGNLSALLVKLAQIIEESRGRLPHWLLAYLPESAEELSSALASWLRANADVLRGAGQDFARALVHILVGMVIGALLSLRGAAPATAPRPVAAVLTERVDRLARSFRRVVFAQVWIAALNTLFTALYLGVALPLLGVHLPLIKTMIAVTFLCGLLPVIGNLISNAVIVLVSLSNSLFVGMGSLAYLVVIHKLEYFLNARIIGTRIRARAWELLAAMLVMEAAFGLSGLLAAPIFYAYFKDELADKELV